MNSFLSDTSPGPFASDREIDLYERQVRAERSALRVMLLVCVLLAVGVASIILVSPAVVTRTALGLLVLATVVAAVALVPVGVRVVLADTRLLRLAQEARAQRETEDPDLAHKLAQKIGEGHFSGARQKRPFE